MKKTLGLHLLLELKKCPPEALNDVGFIQSSMIEAANIAEATIVDVSFHQFNPHGVSGMVIIAESHLSIHTWPEHNYAAIDIFTCGTSLLPLKAIHYLVKRFQSEEILLYKLDRGIFDGEGARPTLLYESELYRGNRSYFQPDFSSH